jgi:hypothetical protein
VERAQAALGNRDEPTRALHEVGGLAAASWPSWVAAGTDPSIALMRE